MIKTSGVLPEGARAHLKALLLARYAHLGGRLRCFSGSRDDVADVLQETWLRLEVMPEASLDDGEHYLLRMMSNLAVDHYRREKRHLHEDVDDTFEVEDELADPERIVAARLNVEMLTRIIRTLPPRQREVLLAARIEGELNREIAQRLGISLRLVEKELNAALEYCARYMHGMATVSDSRAKGRRKF